MIEDDHSADDGPLGDVLRSLARAPEWPSTDAGAPPLGGRFALEARIAAGGMGAIYKARDRESGEVVAVKVQDAAAADAARFEREASTLARLAHPCIVRYVAHGVAEGRPFMAMEWLEGEDLKARLDRGPLTISETIDVARRAAGALAEAHRHGIVHRDLKPANLFLVAGRTESAKLVDFGVVRFVDHGATMTSTGMVVGTPRYMAPEQVRAARDIDARCDVFALGAVLHECLTGRPAFFADDMLSLALKIALEDPPPLSSIRGDVPPALDDLVRRMLKKNPDARPSDGAALLEEVESLGEVTGADALAPWLTSQEKRIVSVVLARVHAPDAAVDVALAPTAAAPSPHGPSLDDILQTCSAVAEWLAGGVLVATIESRGSAADQAIRAAHCALAIRARFPAAPIGVAVGRALLSGAEPVGEAIVRGVHALRASEARAASGRPPVILDEVVAGLLEGRFDIARGAGGIELAGELSSLGSGRTVLGKRTPFVGRDREAAIVQGAIAESIAESVARVVVVTAAPGMGKSRLRRELLTGLEHGASPVKIWASAGSPLGAGAGFGVLRDLVRGAPDARDLVAPAIRDRVHAFLDELLGVGDPQTKNAQVLAARRDPALMHDQIRRAWVDLVTAACASQPLLVVLEDLHWGDRPSVEAIDAALRALADSPLSVIAFARPEIGEAFPDLWRERGVVDVRLGALARKASERLVRAVLGDAVAKERVSEIVDRAAGNAFYLEEIVRAAAGGERDLPSTVLAMVQARLDAMEAPARRVLRAASAFGRVFWRGGAQALLGADGNVAHWLAHLVRLEVLVEHVDSRFHGEVELAFRHEIVRESAYAMLTDDDRARAHRLAGTWLEAHGEDEAVVLAQHFELGELLGDAARWYCRAGERALMANDLRGAIALGAKAEACGATGETLGAVRAFQAEAFEWTGDSPKGERYADEALALLPRGSAAWYRAASALATSIRAVQSWKRADELRDQLLAASSSGRTGPAIVALLMVARALFYGNRWDAAARIVRELTRAAEELGRDDPHVLVQLRYEQSDMAYLSGAFDTSLRICVDAAPLCARIGDRRRELFLRASVGYLSRVLGAFEDAAEVLRGVIEDADRDGLAAIVAHAKHNLGPALAYLGDIPGALAVQRDAVERLKGNPRLLAVAHYYWADIARLGGDLVEAEDHARKGVELAGENRSFRAAALGALAAVLLARVAPEEALAASREAMEHLATVTLTEPAETGLYLVYAKALDACGDRALGDAALAKARDKVTAIATKLVDPALRASYLERIPENAEILRLAERLAPRDAV